MKVRSFTPNGIDSTVLQCLDTLSSMTSEVFYVADVRERRFCHVSPQLAALCGYRVEEILRMGFDFYAAIIHPDDVPMVATVQAAAREYFRSVGKKGDKIDYFSCVFRVRLRHFPDAHPFSHMVYHRAKPVWIHNELRYFICSAGTSVIKKAGYPRMYHKDGRAYEEYGLTTSRWKLITTAPLTERERAALMLAKQGKTGREAADMLSVSYHTLRNIRTSLLRRLNVHSMTQAIVYAANHRWILAADRRAKRGNPIDPLAGTRSRTRVTSEMARRIQEALESGLSIRRTAKQEGVAESAIRYRIKQYGKGLNTPPQVR